ncbi:hypothetical protein ACIPSJ_51655 [Streptomyces sp. NPDC090088]|uniref:hypothetical protein n=1 Tax=Streptomyces sp. NPDC090088 TaxID=3365944 RepID=UPI003811CE97
MELRRVRRKLGRQAGWNIAYTAICSQTYYAIHTLASLSEPVARGAAVSEVAIEKGELAAISSDLARLIGRRPTPITTTIAPALQRLANWTCPRTP